MSKRMLFNSLTTFPDKSRETRERESEKILMSRISDDEVAPMATFRARASIQVPKRQTAA